MAKPLEQLYIEAARDLRVVEASEALSAEDRKVFADRYPEVWAMLEGRGLALWGETSAVPDRYSGPVRALLAEQCAAAFDQTYDAAWALRELYRQAKPPYRYHTVQYEDF